MREGEIEKRTASRGRIPAPGREARITEAIAGQVVGGVEFGAAARQRWAAQPARVPAGGRRLVAFPATDDAPRERAAWPLPSERLAALARYAAAIAAEFRETAKAVRDAADPATDDAPPERAAGPLPSERLAALAQHAAAIAAEFRETARAVRDAAEPLPLAEPVLRGTLLMLPADLKRIGWEMGLRHEKRPTPRSPSRAWRRPRSGPARRSNGFGQSVPE